MDDPRSAALRDEVAFHKQMVRQLKREISMIDRNSRRKYLREFDKEFDRFESVASFDDLVVAAYKADIVYIGDYHTLPQAQAFAARLLRAVAARSRHVHLGMEMVFGRHQRLLDRWMAGDLEESEFLRRIRYQQDWGYEWSSFRRLFLAARNLGIPVLALDCEPRNGLRYIRKRDQYAAQRIAGLLESHPEAKLVVFFGESHLASSHLPQRVREELKERDLERRDLVVVQNIEALYWQAAEEGAAHADVVRCGPGRFCAFNASPLAKYESYRQTIERWKTEGEDEEALDLGPTVYNIIDTILRFLGIDKYRRRVDGSSYRDLLLDVYPEVYSEADRSQFQRLVRGAQFATEQVREIEDHIRRSGSCYVPRLNAIFIGRFDLVHGGEEAAHFVNMALKGEILDRANRAYPRPDLFYVAVIEEALGFFGSKVIDPSRNHFFETDLYRNYKKSPEAVERETGYDYREFRQIIDFILLHKKFERLYARYNDVPEDLLRGIFDEARFSRLTHELGYFLGQQLYDGYQAGKIRRDEVAALFGRRFEPGGDALTVYLDLVEQVADDAHISDT